MSLDREEIRWKFQILLEIVSFTRDLHEGEFKYIDEKWNRSSSDLINARNTIVGGIGFGIGLWVGLMSLDVIGKTTAIFVTIPIVIALIIFVGINTYVNKISQKIFKLDTVYHNHLLEMTKVKSWIAGRALREDVTSEEIMKIIQFNSLITQASAYEAKNTTCELFKSEKPNPDEFRSYYNTAKNPPPEFSIFHIENFPIIPSFIKLFESNESQHSKTH